MKHKVLTAHAERTIAVVFEAGEEVIAPLTRFVQEHNVRAARFTAIGAFSDVRLGYFDVSAQDYVQTAIGTQVEVLSLIGESRWRTDNRSCMRTSSSASATAPRTAGICCPPMCVPRSKCC